MSVLGGDINCTGLKKKVKEKNLWRQILPKKLKENIFFGIFNAKTRKNISVGNDTRLI